VTLRIEPTNESELATEEGRLRTVWGFVHENDEPRAVYFVRWNEDDLVSGAIFFLSFGEWHEGGHPGTRRGVGVLAREYEGRLAFMVIDATDTDFASDESLGIPLPRAQVMGTEYATGTFTVLDRIVDEDKRVRTLRDRIEATAGTSR
jgi:hypothetical protein